MKKETKQMKSKNPHTLLSGRIILQCNKIYKCLICAHKLTNSRLTETEKQEGKTYQITTESASTLKMYTIYLR